MCLKTPICGLDGIAFLFILLTLFECASLKALPFSYFLLAGIFFAIIIVHSIQENLGILFLLAGSLCARLFGYLDYVSKKKKPRKKTPVKSKTPSKPQSSVKIQENMQSQSQFQFSQQGDTID